MHYAYQGYEHKTVKRATKDFKRIQDCGFKRKTECKMKEYVARYDAFLWGIASNSLARVSMNSVTHSSLYFFDFAFSNALLLFLVDCPCSLV